MTASVPDSGFTGGASGTASLTAPSGGTWDFVFVGQRTESAFVQPDPEPVVTSPATLLHFMDGDYRTGEIRSYASAKVSPITASYATGDDFPRNGLAAASISGVAFPDPALVTASTSTQNTLGNLTFTVSPPAGTVEGDLLLVAFAAGRYGGSGEISLTIGAGLTASVNSAVARTRFALCWRVASAADQAGGTSYTISTVNSAGGGAANQGGHMVMLGGLTLTSPGGPVVGHLGFGM